jgi:beta-barrel assembly-enhancing protease
MKRHLFRLLLLSLLVAPLHAQFGRLGRALDKAKDTARSFSELHISDEDERALGEAISLHIRTLYGVQQDEAETRYVTLVGQLVAQKSTRPNLDYQFIILDSDSTNAFAAPGGFVHITRGALALMENEAQLAGVLAHEMVHITERHTINAVQKMRGIELADGQTTLTGNSRVFDLVVEKATEAVLQGFGRAEELESDTIGVQLAAKSGYSPTGLPEFLEALQARYTQRQQRAGLFASHPEMRERLDRLMSQIERQRLDQSATVALPDRFAENIAYKSVPFTGTGHVVEGARGMAEGEAEEEVAEDKQEPEERRGGRLARLRNPLGSGERQQRAEVTGAAAARGVETELGWEEAGDPARVVVEVTPEEIRRFKEEGGLV